MTDFIISNGSLKANALADDLGACFANHWEARDLWIKSLREMGIKGAIFSCAWVDDKNQTMRFNSTSLIFNDGLRLGDKMVLGDWFSPCKLIRIDSDFGEFGNIVYGYKTLNESYEIAN